MKSRGMKVLLGCVIGCGSLIVLGVGSCVGFVFWLERPGEVVDPGSLLGTDTTGYLEWKVSLDDPGTMAFLQALLDEVVELEQRGESPLPEALQGPVAQFRRGQAQRDLNKFLPLVAAWTVRPGAGAGDDLHLLSLSARGLSRKLTVADWVMGWFLGRAEEVEIERYRDEKVYRFHANSDPRSFVAFIRKGILFVTTDNAAATQTIDNLVVDDGSRRDPGALEQLFAALPDERPLRGAFSNARGEVRRIAEVLGDGGSELGPAFWDGLLGVTLSGKFTAEPAVDGVLAFHGSDTTWAATHALSVDEALRSYFEHRSIELVIETSTAGATVAVDLQAADLLGKLEKLDKLEEFRERGTGN